MQTSLKSLDQFTRDIILMKTVEDLKFTDIAKSLKLKESAVKMRYYRGIEIVTNMLKSGYNK